jgi:hypothetical protein
MTSIQTSPAQVNAFRQVRNVNTGAVTHYLAEPYSGTLLEAIFNTGLNNASEIEVDEASEGNDGFTVCVGGQHVRVTFTPAPYESWEDTHELDGTLSPEAEDAERMAVFGNTTEAELLDIEFDAWVARQELANGCPSAECQVRECVMHPDRVVPDATETELFLADEGFPVKIR